MAQNASAQIVTLQQECIKKKDYEVLQNLLRSLSDRVNKVSVGTNTQTAPKEIEQMYNVSQNSSGNMMSASSNQATVVEPNKKDTTDSKPSGRLKTKKFYHFFLKLLKYSEASTIKFYSI